MSTHSVTHVLSLVVSIGVLADCGGEEVRAEVGGTSVDGETTGTDTGSMESGESTTDIETSTETDASDTEVDTDSDDTTGPGEAECGNNIVEAGELCDDGNQNDHDQCTTLCLPPSCDDGIVSNNESDVDCGGPCDDCPVGASCAEATDCATWACIDQVCDHALSCLDLKARSPGVGDGLHVIDVDGDGEREPMTVYCDMTTDGGGWTLLQRTVWEPAETLPLRTGYQEWFSQTIGTAEPGRGYRLAGELWENFNVERDHMLVHHARKSTDLTSCDPLYYVGTAGDFIIDEQSAKLVGLQSDVPMISDIELSTADSGPGVSCVTNNHGVPWFYEMCCGTCPTYQSPYWTEPHPMAAYLTTPDLFENVLLGVCGGADALATAIAQSTHRGINVMEYYAR